MYICYSSFPVIFLNWLLLPHINSICQSRLLVIALENEIVMLLLVPRAYLIFCYIILFPWLIIITCLFIWLCDYLIQNLLAFGFSISHNSICRSINFYWEVHRTKPVSCSVHILPYVLNLLIICYLAFRILCILSISGSIVNSCPLKFTPRSIPW